LSNNVPVKDLIGEGPYTARIHFIVAMIPFNMMALR